ncbi:hypothetical protein M885DRAFT_564821 [Pelagophyceae sp. CCMP2097]|nr:hypothetical protein M885DRAFT_564821 [Pelagophyceae sp. CCMP2097]
MAARVLLLRARVAHDQCLAAQAKWRWAEREVRQEEKVRQEATAVAHEASDIDEAASPNARNGAETVPCVQVFVPAFETAAEDVVEAAMMPEARILDFDDFFHVGVSDVGDVDRASARPVALPVPWMVMITIAEPMVLYRLMQQQERVWRKVADDARSRRAEPQHAARPRHNTHRPSVSGTASEHASNVEKQIWSGLTHLHRALVCVKNHARDPLGETNRSSYDDSVDVRDPPAASLWCPHRELSENALADAHAEWLRLACGGS